MVIQQAVSISRSTLDFLPFQLPRSILYGLPILLTSSDQRGQMKRTWSETLGGGREALFGWYGAFMPEKNKSDGFELPEVDPKKVIAVTEAVKRYREEKIKANEAARSAGTAMGTAQKLSLIHI